MSRNGRLERIRTELETDGLIGRARRERIGTPTTESVGERLARALPAVCPLFALFGRYLGGRTDCLPLRDCLELDGIRFKVEPTPMPRVGELLSAQIGGSIADHFGAFDQRERTSLLHQWHAAELRDGTAVTIKLVRPEARRMVDEELELLPILEELAFDIARAPSLVEDFVVWLDRQLDLSLEMKGLEILADQVEAFDSFEVPTVLSDFCGRNMMITHRFGGTRLTKILGAPGDHRPRLARRLCQAWLQQSLLEGACPEGPLAENIKALSNERFAITGGLVTSLDPRWRRNLIDALVATARQDPDRACKSILEECTELEGAADKHRVRSELRQAEAFRSGGWTDTFTGRHIADSFFVYWRSLADLGYRPRIHAITFIRGFSELDSAARTMAPDTDVMARAIDDFRLVAAAVSVREHLGSDAMIRAAEELTPVIGDALEHPERLTRRLLGEDKDRASDAPETSRRAVSWQVFLGALAMLAAGTIFGGVAINAHPEQRWIEWAVVLGFVAGTSAIFRLVGRNTPR